MLNNRYAEVAKCADYGSAECAIGRPIENRLVSLVSIITRMDDRLREILARTGGERDPSPAPSSSSTQPAHSNDINAISQIALDAANAAENIVSRIEQYI